MALPLTIEQQYANPYTENGQTFFAQNSAVSGLQQTGPLVMTPEQLTPGGPPIQLPQLSTDTTHADAAVAGAGQTAKSLKDYIAELTPPSTELDTKNQTLIDEMSSLVGQDVGRASYTAKLEQDTGLVQRKQALADLNSQILTKNAEYENLNVRLEGQPIPMGDILGQQAQARRQQASEVSLLQARALGMQGQVQAAQDAVDRSVDLKYQTLEELITVKERQLALIQPLLSQSQTRIAQALQNKLDDEKQRIVDEKAKSKYNLGLAVEQGVNTAWVNNFGEIFSTKTGQAFSSEEEFRKASGMTISEAYARNAITNIDYQKRAEGSRGIGDTPGKIRSWLITNKRANSDVEYVELWGQLADELQKQGLNPANYDKQFWEVLHPEGLTGYAKYKGGSSSGDLFNAL